MRKTLKHYGTPRRSGRYPWGSGDDPQRSKGFRSQVLELRKQGITDVDIAKGFGMNSSQLRKKMSLEKNEQWLANAAQALRLNEKGYSPTEIGRHMGCNESQVRSYLNPVMKQRASVTRATADMLKKSVEEKSYIDVGLGTEYHMNISRTKLKTALELLEGEGYKVHKFDIEQVGTGKKTNMMVLTKDDVGYGEVRKNKDKIRMVTDYSEDGGRSFLGLEPIRSVSADRVHVRYAEDGGIDKDGVIELRRGVADISLGNSKYAQVRIGVNDTHYLKGMAIYSDDLPKGADIIYNTNKKQRTPMLGEKDNTVCKPLKDDPDNPFGSTVRQQNFISQEGLKHSKASEMLEMKKKGISYENISKALSIPEETVRKCIPIKALNIVYEEGDWGKWSKTLSSQVLSKQAPSLAKKQLELAYSAKKEEYDEIMSLTNPAVKKFLLSGSNNLTGFAADCDAAAGHLKAAALPRQGAHVILPLPTMKPTEIYAPNYRDGEQVVLIRYPHGGTFEIPQLTVNNKQREAKSVMSQAKDAVGINPKVAERLSGADFDGDTVLVIPNPRGAVKTSSALKGLANFDPKEMYPAYEGMPRITPRAKQQKMGDVSNLITDMTIKGAGTDKIARAVRHSMVVIDSEKHNLNYKQSYIDNGIAALKKEYQGKESGGASTLISKASSQKHVGKRRERIDPVTGEKTYEYTNETFTKVKYRDPSTGTLKETTISNANKKGYPIISSREVKRTVASTKMAEEKDAFALSSGTPMETVYAAHANRLKNLANAARKEAIDTPPIHYSASAKKVYGKEAASLKAQLDLALRNKPLERQAQLLANKIVAAKKESNPDMEADDLKKIKGQALLEARTRVGAKKDPIVISDKEWRAIQAGAISNNVLMQILNNTNLDKVKQLATPRANTTMTSAKLTRAKSMLAAGRTQAEVADALGVSTTALINALG